MLKITRCFQDIRRLKAVTGMTYAEFSAVFPAVVEAFGQTTTRVTRQRQAGGGRKQRLVTSREKRFFIVCYVKCSATVDRLAWLFEVDRAQTHRWGATY